MQGGEFQGQDLVASDGASFDAFGSSIALDGDGILIGAPYRTESGITNIGAGYVFRNGAGGWTQEKKLLEEFKQETKTKA